MKTTADDFIELSNCVYVPEWFDDYDENEVGRITIPTNSYYGTAFLVPQDWLNHLDTALADICAFSADHGWETVYVTTAEYETAIADGDNPDWYTELWTDDGRQFFMSDTIMAGLQTSLVSSEILNLYKQNVEHISQSHEQKSVSLSGKTGQSRIAQDGVNVPGEKAEHTHETEHE